MKVNKIYHSDCLDILPVIEEVTVVKGFLNKIGLTNYALSKGNEEDLTNTDILIKTNDKTLKAEVKTENGWSYGTNNITLDAISAFSWIGRPAKVNRIFQLLPFIRIQTLGTFYQSSNDIIIKMIRNIKTQKQDFFAYDIKKMKDPAFFRYVERNCDIKINPKKSYNRDDFQESAFFCVKLDDPMLQQTEVKNLDDLTEIFKEA